MSFGYIAQAAESERNRRFQNEQNQKRLDLSRDQLDFNKQFSYDQLEANKQLSYDRLDFQKDQWGHKKGLIDYDFEKMKASDETRTDAIKNLLTNIGDQRQDILDQEDWEKDQVTMDPSIDWGEGKAAEWWRKKVVPTVMPKFLRQKYEDVHPSDRKYKELAPTHKIKGKKDITMQNLQELIQLINADPTLASRLPASELLKNFQIASPQVGGNNNQDQRRSLWNQYGNIDYQRGNK